MLATQLGKITETVGRPSDTCAAKVMDFFGSSIPFLEKMPADKCNAMIEISLDDIRERLVIAGERPMNIDASTRSQMWRAIASATPEQRDKFIAAHAHKIPAAGVHRIALILERLPVVGDILEITPHPSLVVAKVALATKPSVHVGEITEVRAVGADIAPRDTQTLIINVINMRAVAHDLINFVVAIARRNLALFAIIAHSDDVIIFLPEVVATVSIGGGCSLSIITASEKKIVSVSDIMHVE